MISISNDLSSRTRSLGLSLSANQIKKFSVYKELIIVENEKYNLVSSADQNSITTHFIDSLSASVCPQYSKAKKVLDIGSGAGFP